MSRWFYVSVALTVFAYAAVGHVYLFHYDDLPEQVPTHWDINFEPDAWTPRDEVFRYFLLVPGIMTGFLALMQVLPWLSPKPFSVDAFRETYWYIMALVQGLFAYLNVVIMYASISGSTHLGQLFLAGFFLFFALLGNVLGRVKRNFWVGVRTPWTLASDAVWNQTHRLAAWLFVAWGVGGFVLLLLGMPFWWIFLGLVAVVLVPVFYSLTLYKRLEREGKV